MSTSLSPIALVHHAWSFTPVRYLVVGGTSFVVDFAVFMSLTEVAVAIPLAQMCARSLGAVVSFLGHKYVSFRAERQASRATHQALLFGSYFVFSLFLSAAVVTGAVSLLGGWRAGGKSLAEMFMVFINFVAARFIFRADQHLVEELG